MQKIVNIISVASGIVSLAVVGSGLYVYVNRASIIDDIKSQAVEAAMGSLGGLGGIGGASGGLGGFAPELPTGSNDISTPDNQAAAPSFADGIKSPF
tara:strand:- start:125 stop:415 length:291 start_codon:yes stop_codon:yes gene_type:complete